MSMKTLHTYFRIFLLSLLLSIENVAWGQGEDTYSDYSVPLATVSAPGVPVVGNSSDNVKDKDRSTQWSVPKMYYLDYLQINNPDNNDDGKRSWIEIPYVPNQNTEIELAFQNTSEDMGKWRSYYILSSGAPGYTTNYGMTFAVGRLGYVYRVCNVTSDENTARGVDYFNTNEHTLICNATGVKIDGTTIYQPETYTYYNGSDNLRFFSSPYDDQQWARSYNGKIFYVKIRENGTLKFDLVPVSIAQDGSDVRYGFYDKISNNFYGFFEMGDYIENAFVAGEAAGQKDNLHIKVPYTNRSTSTASSKNLVKALTSVQDGNSGTSFGGYNADFSVGQQSDGSYALKVEKAENTEGDAWASQLYVNLDEDLHPGDRYYISFSYIATEGSGAMDVWAQSADGNPQVRILNDFSFTQGTLKTGVWSGIVPNDFSSEPMHRLAFHLNTQKAKNTFFFKDFEVRKVTNNLINNGDISNENDFSSFEKKDKSSAYPVTMTREWDGTRSSNVLQVVCNGPGEGNTGGYKYDSQLYLKLNEKLQPGDRYYISFDYKYNGNWTVSTQAHSTAGSHNAMLPISLEFQQNTWKSGKWYGTVTEAQGKNGGMGVIAFDLYNTDGYTGTYQFDNFVVTRVPAPETELEIDFENTYNNTDYSSERYLFSLDDGTFANRKMSFSVIKDEAGRGNFLYKSGTSSLNTGKAARSETFLNKRKTYKFNTEGCVVDDHLYLTSGNLDLNDVTTLSLMGAHNGEPVKSVRGRLYGAKVRENGVVKVDLVPARDSDGQWGLYDKIGKKFYGKCVAGHDNTTYFTGPATDLCAGSPSLSTQDPIVVEFTTEHPIKPNSFAITTGSFANNITTENNPQKWTLKASNDGENWVTLNLAAPKLSAVSTGTPVDLTQSLLKDKGVDTDFEDYATVGPNTNYPNWEGSGFGTGGGVAGPVGERWNQDTGFDTYVKLEGLPAGAYTLSCDGAYRLGGSETGNEAYIYATTSAGTAQKAFHTLASGRMTAEEATAAGINTASNCQTITEGDVTYYVPDQLFTADQWIKAGKYKNNSVSFNVGSNGEAIIGVKRKGAAYDWCFVDNFKLVRNQDYSTGSSSYLYNVESGTFVLGANEWGTRASLSYDEGNEFRVVRMNEGGTAQYKLDNKVRAWRGTAYVTDWMSMYVSDDGVWLDRYTGENRQNWNNWQITEVAKNEYELTVAGKTGKLGSAVDHLGGLSDTRLYYDQNAKNTKWAFVSKTDYDTYKSALTNGTSNLDQSQALPSDTRNLFMVTGNTQAYSMYRLEVESIGGGALMILSELELMTDCGFEHYEGRVYDESLHKNYEIPLNLRVGGTSGYTSKWKKTDPSDDSFTIQRTHEYEHEVYVLPELNTTKTIELLPFADFATRGDWESGNNYRDQYLRWYDYHTDKKSSRIGFGPTECRTAVELEKGHFAWNLHQANNAVMRTQEGSKALYTVPTSNVGSEVLDTIAVEASIEYNRQTKYNKEPVWNGSGYVVKEPTLQWRHTFVIKDARVRANEMSTNNSQYIQAHKIKLMCPANTPFQYPLPSYEYANYSDKNHPTDYYYKTGDSYTAVSHYRIETYNSENTLLGTTTCATTYNITNTNSISENLAYSFKNLDGYNRVFYIKNPQEGTYTIKIFADENDGNGIQIMEYELEVMSDTEGVMLEETKLMSYKENSKLKYSHQIPENMDKAYGKPTHEPVDFDDLTEITDSIGHHYYSWPWAWEHSSYGFGYTQRGDYNMYMVADHSLITPYHNHNDNVYDRLYHDTNGAKQGYFFYANAASDPGRMASVNIGDDFCKNTRVYVSAWICELQGENEYAETANVVFSFRGVDSKGKETVLNSFVSGYVPGGWNTPKGYISGKTTTKDSDGNDVTTYNFVNESTNPNCRGKWMHVYYSFTTNDDTDYDHYIITLENNATSSFGADYAIDDIRCYVRKPKMDARIMEPVCDGDQTTELEMFGDFGLLYDTFAMQANTSDDVYLQYCFLDKDVYEENMLNSYNALSRSDNTFKTTYPTLEEWRTKARNNVSDKTAFETACINAFDDAKVEQAYGTHTESGNEVWNTYGLLHLNRLYDSNPDYVYVDDKALRNYNTGKKYTIEDEEGTVLSKNMYFSCSATDSQIKAGKSYLIIMKKVQSNSVQPLIAADKDIEGACSASSEFKIPLPAEIKIDGKLQSTMSGMSYCANQRPEIEIDLNGIKKGGEEITADEVKFDWYYGPRDLEEIKTIDNVDHKYVKEQGYTRGYMQEERDGILLSTAITNFRLYNHDVTEETVRDADRTTDTTTGITFKTETEAPQAPFTKDMLWFIQDLVLEGRLSLNKDKAFATSHMYGESLYPATQTEFFITAIPINPYPERTDISFCLNAINVVLKVSEFTPTMKNGDSKVTLYPATLQDVPLRIGLKQLQRAVVADLSSETIENLEAASKEKQLWMPVRAIKTVTENAVNLKLAEDYMIYLVDSNDPQVKAGEAGAIPVDEAESPLKGAMISGKSYVAGKVLGIQATKGGEENVCQLAFLKKFQFREGYWYTMKFHFREVFVDGKVHEEVCPGDLVFTIKVVPEYQMWTGAVSRNWNDDRNWRRVTSQELLWPDVRITDATKDYITNGIVNDNDTTCFAPADFTKVIIPEGVERVPYMYDLHETGNKTSVQYTAAPAAATQLASAIPAANLAEINDPDSYAANLREGGGINLDGKIFVITDETGKKTLGVTHETGVRPNGEQDVFAITNTVYKDDMHVYAKFSKVEKTGLTGDIYTIQLCSNDGTHYSLWGSNGYLNFNPSNNAVFALGLGKGQTYGQDGENCGLWRVVQSGDGVTIENVGKSGYYLNPSAATPSTSAVVCKLATSFSTSGAGESGLVTSLVQYDMASIDITQEATVNGKTVSVDDVACRPWYDHTCDQIHFNSGAAMMDQRYLYYNKAWCDIEVPVGTWQTVASPLMNIVAGDLYLPTDGARQNTPLFEDITYDTDLNDRFKPAVYQHSWNNANSMVFELDKSPRDVGISLDWSHVYNDVNVPYGAGQGFAIKVDVSALDESKQPGKNGNPDKAKFRFPKADKEYMYYSPGNTNPDITIHTVVDGNKDADGNQLNYKDRNTKRPGRLSDLSRPKITANSDPSSPYYLVGNPLMCWLDMNAFFNANNKFEKKYWIVTPDGQRVAMYGKPNEESQTEVWYSTTEDNPQFIAPGVSFIVKLNGTPDATTSLDPQFTATMMSYTQGEVSPNRPSDNDPTQGSGENGTDYDSPSNGQNGAKTRAASSAMPQLSLTATDNNGRQTKALLTDGTMMPIDGVETLFDSNLKDDALLYTTKDGMAKTIASIAPGDTLPLAVSGARDEVKLSIEGVKDFDFDLFLIDSEEGTVTPLEGDVVLKQDASGVRYYIATRSANDTEMEGDVNVPRVVSKDGYITVYAPATCEIETSAIYNTGGIRMDFAEHILDSHSVKLYPGVYIVKLLADGRTYSYKLLVR